MRKALIGLTLSTLLIGGVARADFIDKVNAGNKAFEAGDYKTALQNYSDAETEVAEKPELQYNIGGAAYMLGDYEKAEEYFNRAMATTDIGLEEKAHYNLGNTYFRTQDYQK